MAGREPTSELKHFLSAFEADICNIFCAVRAIVLDEAEGTREIAYEAYGAVASAFTFTGELTGAFCNIAAHHKHVTLNFPRGAELSDPLGLLQGHGPNMRSLKLMQIDDTRSPAMRELVREAVANARRPAINDTDKKPAQKKSTSKPSNTARMRAIKLAPAT